MFPGSNSITITINGIASGLQSAVVSAQSSLNQLGQNANSAGSQGFSAFQRFAITLSSIADLARMAADALAPVLNTVEQLGQQMFQLNVTTEKNVYAWQYLFGGKQNAANLALWSSQFSMDIPFTRQDTMGAVSTLGTKFNYQQVEQYMPILADLASTVGATAYGGQGLTMQQAAYALIDLMMGRSQMFKMEFHINPEDLIKYGLNAKATSTGAVHINDMSTLFPALQRYDLAHGYAGAAKGTATNTWWGEWSSFIDRLQNFGLEAGGTALNGQVNPNSFFGQMKTALNDVSTWMDKHQSLIRTLADLIGNVLGGAVKDAKEAFQGFFSGLQTTGIGQDVEHGLAAIAKWLADKNVQKGIQQFGQAFGQIGGGGLKDLGATLQGFFQGLTGAKAGPNALSDIQNFGKWLNNPQTQKSMHDFGQNIGDMVGKLITVVGWLEKFGSFLLRVEQWLSPVGKALDNFRKNPLQLFSVAWGNVWSAITNFPQGAVGLVKQFLNTLIDAMNAFFHLLNHINLHIPRVDIAGHVIGGNDVGLNIPDIPHLALGGRILSSGIAIVGERGAEPVLLPAGAEVGTHDMLDQLIANGGGMGGTTHRYGDNHITQHIYGSQQSIIERLIERKFAERGAFQSAQRRMPGTQAVIGSWGAGRGVY